MANKKSNGKALEIDGEAYRRLEDAKAEDESFSEVIKRYVRPKQSAEEVLRVMRQAAVSAATLEAIDESASRRRKTGHRTKV